MAIDTPARLLTGVDLMAHLYRRAGFGATRDEIEAALAKGYEATVEELLHPERQPDIDFDILHRFYPDIKEAREIDVNQANWLYRMINTGGRSRRRWRCSGTASSPRPSTSRTTRSRSRSRSTCSASTAWATSRRSWSSCPATRR